MSDNLRYDIADQRLTYDGQRTERDLDSNRVDEFNHRHRDVLSSYGLKLKSLRITNLQDRINMKSNLGALRNRQLRQSVVLAAGFSAMAVGLKGRGSLAKVPKEQVTKQLSEELKRANDRTAAQVMAEVLQITTESLPVGEEVIIESAITEGVRVKPGKEAGGNPTISVGAVFGKREHRANYGLKMPPSVTMLSMGNDVVEGTTKSVKGLHSSMTTLFVTESNIKRHLPDIYVQRWMACASFDEFNPRDISLEDSADIISSAYGFKDRSKLSAFFLDRPRHYPAMDQLNKAGVATPYDKDGDMLPGVVLGADGLKFPDGRGLYSMIGEIGGSAEWAVGVLPLVWRGGQAIGMLTSQSSLTRKDLSPEELWNERFHFTEEEFMLMQDARFERKPHFTISDILEDPFAGGISAFAAITDSYYIPFAKGVETNPETNTITVCVVTVNSLGVMDCWRMEYQANESIAKTTELLSSPKESLGDIDSAELEKSIGAMLDDQRLRKRFRLFFNNEYYPALIPVRDKMILLNKAVEGLIDRNALSSRDRDIIEITNRLAPEWFVGSD